MQAIVDRIDGNLARVLVGDDGVAVAVPVKDLPPRAGEGTVLCLKFSIDQAATAARDAKRRATV